MAGNSFETHDGSHVPGAVAMAVGDDGQAVPVGEHTPIGKVRIEGFTFEQFCRALAAHAVLCGKSDDMESAAEQIRDFALKEPQT
jgi:hypothetical protein